MVVPVLQHLDAVPLVPVRRPRRRRVEHVTVRVRRARFVFLAVVDRPTLDLASLLAGEARTRRAPSVVAFSVLRGAAYALSAADLRLLFATPSEEWVPAEELPDFSLSRVERLAERALLLLDPSPPQLAALRALDDALSSTPWHPAGALYHALTRWRDVGAEGVELDEALVEPALAAFVDHYGPPPPALHSLRERHDAHDLPLTSPGGSLFRTLERRRSTRVFDTEASISEEELATVLRYTFGAHGYARAHEQVVALAKTSPSAGGLHAVEAYPLVLRVDGIGPGLYHYEAGRHSLELVASLSRAAAETLAVRLGAGQPWMARAAAVCVLTARFSRTFWKYRHQERAYAVVLMDAAHLSQTFQLVCTELGLGTLFTAAVNAAAIDEVLGIDGFTEGSVGACLCGRALGEPSPLQPRFSPFTPRETRT